MPYLCTNKKKKENKHYQLKKLYNYEEAD